MTNVVISCSFRFEEVNLLLEILKLNFEGPIKTFVFCNLNEEGWAQWGHILDLSLVDELIRVPDPLCHPTNTTRDSKRRQPLQMFCQIVGHFGRLQENFVYLEGDCYPLDETKFLSPFTKFDFTEAVANHFDFSQVYPKKFENPVHQKVLELAKSQTHKMPDGYVCPGYMYVSGKGAQKLFKYIIDNVESLLDGKKNFEGCLGVAFTKSDIKYEPISSVFHYVQPGTEHQYDPVTSIIHCDNAPDYREEFIKRGFINGKMVNSVLSNEKLTRAATNVEIIATGCSPSEGRLFLNSKRRV